MYESSVVQHFLQKGTERGKKENAVENILDVLSARFPSRVVLTLRGKLKGLKEHESLKRLLREAVQVQSLEAFTQKLDAHETVPICREKLFAPMTRQEAGERFFEKSSFIQPFLQEGVNKGARENIIESILDVLTVRFSSKEVSSLEPMLESIAELQHFKFLLRAAMKAPTLEAFVQTLEENERKWRFLARIPEEVLREPVVIQHFTQLGERKNALEALLDVLEIRFQRGVAQALKPALEAVEELQRLKQLHRAAVRVSNLDEFLHLLASSD